MELAGMSFDIETARATIAGYCFHEEDSDVTPPPRHDYGMSIGPLRTRRWGYLSYDCQRGPGPPPDIVDIVAPVLLNVTQGFGVRLVSDLLAIAPEVREVVEPIDRGGFRFWHLVPDEVAPGGDPRSRPESLALHQAWYLIESIRGCDVAVTHKLLHHAWPHLFPLIDNRTIDKLGRNAAWVRILEDLHRHSGEFDELELWFEELARGHGEVSLTRLRLYDILLWCRVVEEEAEASEHGGDLTIVGKE